MRGKMVGRWRVVASRMWTGHGHSALMPWITNVRVYLCLPAPNLKGRPRKKGRRKAKPVESCDITAPEEAAPPSEVAVVKVETSEAASTPEPDKVIIACNRRWLSCGKEHLVVRSGRLRVGIQILYVGTQCSSLDKKFLRKSNFIKQI